MIQFERSFDWQKIKEIATHPRIYPHITDDFSPTPEVYEPFKNDAVWYILVKDDDELLGMWALIPDNAICWKIHTCLLPNAWGDRAKEAGRQVIQWIFSNTSCLRIITDVPTYNRLALRFALAVGLQKFGLNEQSHMKHGRLHDLIMLGISKNGAG